MKKLIILSTLLVLLTVTALPALAKHATSGECGTPPSQPNQRYALAGWITGFPDSPANVQDVIVYVAVGNVLAAPCIGDYVIIDATTAILKLQGGYPIDFDDLDVGQTVSSNGYIDSEGVWSALQITVGADLVSKDPPPLP